MDFPTKNRDFPVRYINLPEGNLLARDMSSKWPASFATKSRPLNTEMTSLRNPASKDYLYRWPAFEPPFLGGGCDRMYIYQCIDMYRYVYVCIDMYR